VTPGYSEFEFDLPAALLKTLVSVLDQLPPVPLTEENLASIPKHQGVYQLLLMRDGHPEVVYIGKTDAKSGLRDRLNKHFKKVQHRHNLEPGEVLFKAVRVFVFTAVDLEAQLIAHSGGVAKVSWNGSGFGSKDPGRERDTTKYKIDHFDTQFPIDINRVLDFEIPRDGSAAAVLRILKTEVPYLIRYETLSKGSRIGHSDLEDTPVEIVGENLNSENVIRQVIQQLPSGWHATLLPSHIIIYKDDPRKFPSGRRISQSD
jgi:hypothetical protein